MLYKIFLFISILFNIEMNNFNEKKLYDKFKLESEKYKFKFINEKGNIINHKKIERPEQFYAHYFIKPNDIVLELGARYGTVSCTINKKLKNKLNHVVVEPDKKVWKPLRLNKKYNNSYFHIIEGFISKKKYSLTYSNKNTKSIYYGYDAKMKQDSNTDILSYDLYDIQKDLNLKFNVLIADCEGCLCDFLFEYEFILKQLRMIMYEKDGEDICDYNKVITLLKKYNFKLVKKSFDSHQFVWLKL